MAPLDFLTLVQQRSTSAGVRQLEHLAFAALINKQVFEIAGKFEESLTYDSSLLDFLVRAKHNGMDFAFLPEYLVYYTKPTLTPSPADLLPRSDWSQPYPNLKTMTHQVDIAFLIIFVLFLF